MVQTSSNPKFVADRITQIRIEHKISEYQLSLDLGFSKGYIQAISSGNIMPSMAALYKICEYFEISPTQFFCEGIESQAGSVPEDSKLLKDLGSAIRELSVDEQYALYHFLKGGKLQAETSKRKSSSRGSRALRRQESDK